MTKFELNAEYRKDLAKKLKTFRAQGNEGKELAEVLLAQARETEEYKHSKICLSSAKTKLRKSISKGELPDDDDIKEGWITCCKILEEQKKVDIPYAEGDDALIGEFISVLLCNKSDYMLEARYIDELGVEILKQHFKYLSQEQREKTILSALKRMLRTIRMSDKDQLYNEYFAKFCVSDNYDSVSNEYLTRHEGWFNYSHERKIQDSSERTITPMVEQTINNSTNDEFIRRAIPYLRYEHYSKNKTIQDFFSKKDEVQKLIDEKSLSFKTLINWYGALGKKLSVDEALDYESIFNDGCPEGLQDIITEESMQNLINNIIKGEEFDEKMFQKAKKLGLSSERILDKIGFNRLSAKLINANLKHFTNILSKDTVIYLLENIIINDEEKVSSKIYENLRYYGYPLEKQQKLAKTILTKCDVDIFSKKLGEGETRLPLDGSVVYDTLEKIKGNDTTWIDKFPLNHFFYGDSYFYYDVIRPLYGGRFGDDSKELEEFRIEKAYSFLKHRINSVNMENIRELATKFNNINPIYFPKDLANLFLKRLVKEAKNHDDLKLVFNACFRGNYGSIESLYLKYILNGEIDENEIAKASAIPKTIYMDLIQRNHEVLKKNPLPKVVADPNMEGLENLIAIKNQATI